MNKREKYFICSGRDGIEEIIRSSESPKMWSEGGKYTSRSCGYESLKELIDDNGILPEKCKECGGYVRTTFSTYGPILKEKNMCFTCNFWLDVIADKENPRRVIRKGMSYFRKDFEKEKSHCLGFGGSIFTIEMKNGEIHTTNNLWSNGTIPNRFLGRLPDNAIFSTDKE